MTVADEASRELLNVLAEAVLDLDADKRAMLRIGIEVTKERSALLSSTGNSTSRAAGAIHSTV